MRRHWWTRELLIKVSSQMRWETSKMYINKMLDELRGERRHIEERIIVLERLP
jgi:hypothetical protein